MNLRWQTASAHWPGHLIGPGRSAWPRRSDARQAFERGRTGVGAAPAGGLPLQHAVPPGGGVLLHRAHEPPRLPRLLRPAVPGPTAPPPLTSQRRWYVLLRSELYSSQARGGSGGRGGVAECTTRTGNQTDQLKKGSVRICLPINVSCYRTSHCAVCDVRLLLSAKRCGRLRRHSA